MATITMREIVASKKPFNPVSGSEGQGRSYSGNNLVVLDEAMVTHGWEDPRFVTKAQIHGEKWTLVDGAVSLPVWTKPSGEWKEVEVFNACQVLGMPSLDEMLRKADALRPGAPKNLDGASDIEQGADGSLCGQGGGVMMNPLTGSAGKVFRGKSAATLSAAMAAMGWADGRFVTASQIDFQGWQLAENAKRQVVNEARSGGFVNVEVFNASEVLGMPSIEQMFVERMAGRISVSHAAYALAGVPHDPTNPDRECLLSVGEHLEQAMIANGWIDPRFVPAESVTKNSYELAGGAVAVDVGERSYYSATQIPALANLPNLEAWQGIYRQQLRLEKERQKEWDYTTLAREGETFTDNERLESLPGTVMRLNTASRMVEIVRSDGSMTSFGGKPAIENFAQRENLGSNDQKRMIALDALGVALRGSGITDGEVPVPETGRYFGRILATKNGLAIQDSGRGKLVGHALGKFDDALKPGQSFEIRYKAGGVKVTRQEGIGVEGPGR